MTFKLDLSDVFHYGTTVRDMDKAVEQWVKMGAKILMPPVEAEGVGVFCCIINYNGANIELVAPSTEESLKNMEPRLQNPGMIEHIAYFTDDMEEDIQAHIAKGGEIVLPKTFNTGFDRNMAFLKMPTGLVVELMDRKAAGKKSADPLKEFKSAVRFNMAA